LNTLNPISKVFFIIFQTFEGIPNNNLSIIPSAQGTAGSKVVLGAYNGSTWKSMVQFENETRTSQECLDQRMYSPEWIQLVSP
jgi:hypothetical protein